MKRIKCSASFVFDTQLHPQPCHLTGILGNPGHFQYGGTRYPLTWQKGGTQLSCAKCGRYYG